MEIPKIQQSTETKLKRIAWLSEMEPSKEFSSLMPYFNDDSLKECFTQLNGKKAVGTDVINKEQYGQDLDKNINDLIIRMKNMSYRPGPIRQVLIPKEGKVGAIRSLGISNLEDKIIQKMTKRILTSIYEPIFLNSSYGFRDGISCHDAIRDLSKHLNSNEVQVVIDIDLENYFGSIDRKLLEEMLRRRIKDEKFMRYIIRMFKSGLLVSGNLAKSE